MPAWDWTKADHFRHHSHAHRASSNRDAQTVRFRCVSLSVDEDCGLCHYGASGSTLGPGCLRPSTACAGQAQVYGTHPPGAERPNWLALSSDPARRAAQFSLSFLPGSLRAPRSVPVFAESRCSVVLSARADDYMTKEISMHAPPYHSGLPAARLDVPERIPTAAGKTIMTPAGVADHSVG